MATNQPALKAAVLSLLNTGIANTTDQETALDTFAETLATLITAEIKAATVTLPLGTVNVAGGAGTMTNPAPITTAIIT